ncbi:hypothetical protein EGW08_019492, partial [Elysia chlorotica]
MEGLSTLGIVVLIAGIALFIIILASFIVWKVRFENAPRSASRPVGQEMTRPHQDQVPQMVILPGRESTGSTGLNEDQYNYIDLSSNGTSNNNLRDVPKPDHDDATPLTTFNSPVSPQSETVEQQSDERVGH